MKPKYVIINKCDAPHPSMVCQWVDNVGYCYMSRKDGKPNYDDMRGDKATNIEAFGFSIAENADGSVKFFKNKNSWARYSDGKLRNWQHRANTFEYQRLTLLDVILREELLG